MKTNRKSQKFFPCYKGWKIYQVCQVSLSTLRDDSGYAGYSCHLLIYICKTVISTMVLEKRTEPSCSKLTMSLVNDSLKFTLSDTQICRNVLLKKCE